MRQLLARLGCVEKPQTQAATVAGMVAMTAKGRDGLLDLNIAFNRVIVVSDFGNSGCLPVTLGRFVPG